MAFKFGNSLQRNTPAIYNLIIINGLVYLAQILITQFDVTTWGALHYYKSPLFHSFQLVTNMFMHDPDNFFHIIFNMFTLWIFGSILEKYWGSQKFLIFYLICGVGASIVIELFIPFSAEQFVKSIGAIPDGFTKADVIEQYKQQYEALGASGAIMGVMAAFAYLFPNTELYVMFIPIPLKAKYVIPVFILIDVFGGIHQFKGDNVGHFAHLGGALIGFLLVLFWNKTNRETLY
jgi:membrane associated rhomboid family serine protease